jgi:hypothetical protein
MGRHVARWRPTAVSALRRESQLQAPTPTGGCWVQRAWRDAQRAVRSKVVERAGFRAGFDSAAEEVESRRRSMTMRRHLAPFLLAPMLVLGACGGGEEASSGTDSAASAARSATPAAKGEEKVAFALKQENRSGASGAATLRGGGDGFTVVLAVKRPGMSGPAHIHDVTCQKYRALQGFDAQLATVDLPLTDLVDGKSTTRGDSGLSVYRTGEFSINVHSTEGGFPVTACGDIPPG